MGPALAAGPEPAAGEYLFRAAGCAGCHTDGDHAGAFLAGGRELMTPLGVFYSPNITPDKDTGIGRWQEADFLRALRHGRGPDGRHYYPSFPYAAYTRLSDADMRALWAYLKTVPPVRQANRPHELPWYLKYRSLLSAWKWLYFRPGPYLPNPVKDAAWNRGAYLAQAAAHCGECHTPRNRLGGFRIGLYLAGDKVGAEGGLVPNITPDKETGIGRWSRSELIDYLKTGMRPDGDFAGGLMAEVVDNGLKHLSQQDIEAIATYLQSVPPVMHAVRKPKPEKAQEEFEY
ncbi:MAG: c-type cytochrome [Hydrogenophilaceae bacterium]|nr:c-type cytochrome [Hydrogenophilaceae bacterium]